MACQNCGHGSHCGTALYNDRTMGQDGLPIGIKICDSCRCDDCEPSKCFKCHEVTTHYKRIEYRDHKDERKGEIRVCISCLNKEGIDDE